MLGVFDKIKTNLVEAASPDLCFFIGVDEFHLAVSYSDHLSKELICRYYCYYWCCYCAVLSEERVQIERVTIF